mgnify:CR=1 FL=1
MNFYSCFDQQGKIIARCQTIQDIEVLKKMGRPIVEVKEMKNEAPELYNSLLRQRNLNWIPQIDQMLRDNGTEFVLVGAAHLVGDEGLLKLLEAKGYQVTQL